MKVQILNSGIKLDSDGYCAMEVVQAENEAYGAFCRAAQWSAKYRTKGFVPYSVATAIAHMDVWCRLETCDDISRALVRPVCGGWQIVTSKVSSR